MGGRGSSGRGSSGAGTRDTQYFYASPDTIEKKNPDIAYDAQVKYKAQINAIGDYTGGGYRILNSYLNGRQLPLSETAKENLDDEAVELESCIQGKTSENLIVYRGIHQDMEDLDIGDKIVNGGFTSATISKKKAIEFANSAVVKIKVKRGTRALFIGQHGYNPTEQEILFGRNAVITITGKENDMLIGELKYGKGKR